MSGSWSINLIISFWSTSSSPWPERIISSRNLKIRRGLQQGLSNQVIVSFPEFSLCNPEVTVRLIANWHYHKRGLSPREARRQQGR
uniref:Uncharacterized protein n=1 Tax=Candidatus Kentrum sp. DK TaxID=2126562 RepID=A0A450SCW4_9GAMM|nr:MAG: hypothetical protein BECKDK2373B_GA0170837_102725 [Candidatus Kentron sp. DK]